MRRPLQTSQFHQRSLGRTAREKFSGLA